MTPCAGKVRLISVRIAASAARSAAVTGSKPPERLLFSTPIAVRKNGRMVSPETAASSSTKAAKSIAVIAVSAVRVPVTELAGSAMRELVSDCAGKSELAGGNRRRGLRTVAKSACTKPTEAPHQLDLPVARFYAETSSHIKY